MDFGQAALLQPNANAFVGRGLVREMTSDLQMAIADFRRAIEIEPRNLDTVRGRALLWIRADEIDNAIEDCNRVLSVSEDDAEALTPTPLIGHAPAA